MSGDIIDLAVTLDTNFYQDKYNLSIQIKAVKMANIDQDAYFEGKQLFDDFVSGYDTDYTAIFPTRAEVGSVYKMIMAGPISAERLRHVETDIGYGKTQTALKTLNELGLVSLNNGVWVGHTTNQKSDLMNSVTYKKLYEGVNTDE